jgi:hypothetical protein
MRNSAHRVHDADELVFALNNSLYRMTRSNAVDDKPAAEMTP